MAVLKGSFLPLEGDYNIQVILVAAFSDKYRGERRIGGQGYIPLNIKYWAAPGALRRHFLPELRS